MWGNTILESGSNAGWAWLLDSVVFLSIELSNKFIAPAYSDMSGRNQAT